LTGHVTDRFVGTPINGVQVVIDQPRGVTGPDGKYLVQSLSGATVSVIYKKDGYDTKREDVPLEGVLTNHDTQLTKNTAVDAYWFGAAQKIHERNTGQAAQQQAFISAWKEIDGSTLTPGAKASAARQFYVVLPLKTDIPVSFSAYKDVDPALLPDAATGIERAVAGSEALSVSPAKIPAPVAEDIAATQVTNFEKAHRKQVNAKFYADFTNLYGSDSSARLIAKVNKRNGPEM
jgi:hypothetical protein